MRVLADENIKLTFLTTKPADIESPTATELNAGIDVSLKILFDTYQWTAGDSAKVGERALGEGSASEVPGAGSYTLDVTAWRQFTTSGGGFDATADAFFEAVKEKGTTLWAYERRMNKKHTTPWAAGDEIHLGGEVVTDTPQAPGNEGFIKYRVPLSAQQMVDFGTVGAGA